MFFTFCFSDTTAWQVLPSSRMYVRGAGFIDKSTLKDSSLQMRSLLEEKIGLYASPDYLNYHASPALPEELENHRIIFFSPQKKLQKKDTWTVDGKLEIPFKPIFSCNDIESCLQLCRQGEGIGRFTELNVRDDVVQKKLIPILQQHDWGKYYLFAVYPQQRSLPQRTRLLLDFISAHVSKLISRI